MDRCEKCVNPPPSFARDQEIERALEWEEYNFSSGHIKRLIAIIREIEAERDEARRERDQAVNLSKIYAGHALEVEKERSAARLERYYAIETSGKATIELMTLRQRLAELAKGEEE